MTGAQIEKKPVSRLAWLESMGKQVFFFVSMKCCVEDMERREGEREIIASDGEARGFNRPRPFVFGDGEDRKKGNKEEEGHMEFEGTWGGKKRLGVLFEFLDYSSRDFK